MLDIMAPALLAGTLIVLTHAPLGLIVLKRGIIFMDLAIAQLAGLGLIMTGLVSHNSLVIQAGALASACLGAGLFHQIEKKHPAHQEAFIGVSFVVAVAILTLLMATHPMGSEMTHHLLSGNILFITWDTLLYHAPVYVVIGYLCWRGYHRRFFYGLFAIAITSSVQLVGVYVVFASLILPALAATVSPAHALKTAWLSGIISVITGLSLSVITGFPAGPVLVLAFTAVTLVLLTVKKRGSIIT